VRNYSSLISKDPPKNPPLFSETLPTEPYNINSKTVRIGTAMGEMLEQIPSIYDYPFASILHSNWQYLNNFLLIK